MNPDLETRVISKEEAHFWLDRNGNWHNPDGVFVNRKIIDFFHSIIQKDDNGYFLFQEYKGKKEKVYFYYEDTALFVFDVLETEENFELVLNTGKKINLTSDIFFEGKNLYIKYKQEKIKFVGKALHLIAKHIYEENGGYWIRFKNLKYKISFI